MARASVLVDRTPAAEPLANVMVFCTTRKRERSGYHSPSYDRIKGRKLASKYSIARYLKKVWWVLNTAIQLLRGRRWCCGRHNSAILEMVPRQSLTST